MESLLTPELLRALYQYNAWANGRTCADVGRDLVNFVSGLKAEDLPRPREYRSIIDGKTYSQPLWQTLQHLVNHGTYHRGQIATLLRQLGTKAVSTDLTIFYRENPKPAATS